MAPPSSSESGQPADDSNSTILRTDSWDVFARLVKFHEMPGVPAEAGTKPSDVIQNGAVHLRAFRRPQIDPEFFEICDDDIVRMAGDLRLEVTTTDGKWVAAMNPNWECFDFMEYRASEINKWPRWRFKEFKYWSDLPGFARVSFRNILGRLLVGKGGYMLIYGMHKRQEDTPFVWHVK